MPAGNTEPDFMTSSDALPPGYLLHQYRISKTLGGGGFSIVYLARDIRTKQLVVIKEYIPGEQATRRDGETVESLSVDTATTFNTGLKRFLDEANSLSKINHPNIVRVIDFFRENNTVYMVMNYEQGKDLRWYIKRHDGRMTEKFIRTVFPQLLVGLRELHNHRLLHLDIKPANVYLRNDGSPVLIDFGAARQVLSSEDSKLPPTYTPGFAPPEMHLNRGLLGPWSDIYSVGATMYACFAGAAPQSADARLEKDLLVPASRAFAKKYAPDLLRIVDWCLELVHLRRPQSVLALQKALLGEMSGAKPDHRPG